MTKSNRFKELSAALKKTEDPQPEQETASPTKARKKGKRSDPNYEQVGFYLEKSLHLEVKKRLLDEPDKDFSDLVNELIKEWLTK